MGFGGFLGLKHVETFKGFHGRDGSREKIHAAISQSEA
jgi:hypothetical protein